MRDIPQSAFDFIDHGDGKSFNGERCILRVYDDAQPNKILQPGDEVHGKLTAGRGHTGGLYIGLTVTQAQADQWTWADLSTARMRLSFRIGDVIDQLTENQFVALLSFVFNCGTGDEKKPEWNIWKVLRAKQFDQVPIELARFVNGKLDGKTVKIAGLVNRRNAEIALWSTEEPGSVPLELPSSITRAIATPPTVADPVPARKSGTILSGVATAVVSVGVAAKQVSDAITPYAAQSHYAQSSLAILATIGAACAAATVLFAFIHKRNAQH